MALSFSALSFTTVLGYCSGSDLITALSLVTLIVLIFLFYFFYTNTKEHILRNAAQTALLIEKDLKTLTPDTRAEEILSTALSIPYLPPKLSRFSFLNSAYGVFLWQPFHTLIELLLIKATEHLITQIKLLPTNLHYHAALANLYVTLSNHYTRPLSSSKKVFMLPSMKTELEQKSKIASKRAVEELFILRSFAPNELWVHDQLAISYRELSLPQKEIEEYETILTLNPEDYNALLRLGILYFIQGEIAKGLEIYERLNDVQPLLAETLINHYGAYNPL
jgi:tetratricopeptide (TPR) repeat protein